MNGSRRDEYVEYAPVLRELAALNASDPRRARLRDELVTGYLPVAQHIARRFARRGEPLDDLEQVATIGLIQAIDRFEPSRERDLLSYAVPTITGEIRRHFRDRTWAVRTPRSIKDRHIALRSATTALSARLGRAPTVGELAEHLGISPDAVAEAVAATNSRSPSSLDAPIGATRDDAGATLADTLTSGDPDLDRAEDRAMLRELIGDLPERERTILVLRFVHDWTQSMIAAELCISQMHVSRLLARTLDLLRERVGTVGEAADDAAVLVVEQAGPIEQPVLAA